jgi:glycosyltransferase involved in cell wall biosynthesis
MASVSYVALPSCAYRHPIIEAVDSHLCLHALVRAQEKLVSSAICAVCSIRLVPSPPIPASNSSVEHADNHLLPITNGHSGIQLARISFCVALMNRGKNFLKMLASWEALEDDQCELVIADFGSTDIDLAAAVSSLSRVRVINLQGPFNRARGLNAAAASASGELLFFLDADIVLPRGLCSALCGNTAPGQAYFPVCYSLRESSLPDVSADGWWRYTGYGLCGIHRNDYAVLNWDEAFTSWGREDNDLFCRTRAKLRIVRERCPGLLHLWHPDTLAFKNRYQQEIQQCDYATPTVNPTQICCSHKKVFATAGLVPLMACQYCRWRELTSTADTSKLPGSSLPDLTIIRVEPIEISFCVTLQEAGDSFLRMLRSFASCVGVSSELIVADFKSADSDLQSALKSLKCAVTVVSIQGPFSCPLGLSVAASIARGRYVVFLDQGLDLPVGLVDDLKPRISPGHAFFGSAANARLSASNAPPSESASQEQLLSLCGFHTDDLKRIQWHPALNAPGWGLADLYRDTREQVAVEAGVVSGLYARSGIGIDRAERQPVPVRSRPLRLVVVPSDPIDAYVKKGRGALLAEYYNPQGFFDEVFVLSPRETRARTEIGLTIIPTSQQDFSARVAELQPDLIRAYGGYWPAEYACAHKNATIPTIVSVHDTNPQLLSLSVKEADRVICMSDAVRSLVLSIGVDPSKITTLPNRVNLGVFRPVVDQASLEAIDMALGTTGCKRILHVGRKDKQKNLDTVIRALTTLPTDYHAVFVGQGSTSPYVALARSQGVEGRCHWVPTVQNGDLPEWYSWCDCFCVPSRWEGFGIVFIEAAACGAKIVSSNIAPMTEILRNEHDALLVNEYENPTSVGAAIKRVCCDVALGAELKEHAIETGRKYDSMRIDQAEIAIYQSILQSRVKAAGQCDSSVAVAMIAAPRRQPTLESAIHSVRNAGFNQAIQVFAEPSVWVPDLPGVTVHENKTRLGALLNWTSALRWLVNNTTAQHLLLLEDDVELCMSAESILAEQLAKHPDYGTLSLFLSAHCGRNAPQFHGWHAVTSHKTWGTVATCFNRKYVEGFLGCDALEQTDASASPYDLHMRSYYLTQVPVPSYIHCPSLAEHHGWNETTIPKTLASADEQRRLRMGYYYDVHYQARSDARLSESMGSPEVSILLPTYNRSTLLHRCIDSLLAQTYANWELIIIDDGSTDDTRNVLMQYSDPRLLIVAQPNRKLPGALNTGHMLARGTYVTWLSDDCWVDRDWLESLHNEIKNLNNSYGLVNTDYTSYTGASGRLVRTLSSGLSKENRIGASFMYRRSVRESIGDYDEGLVGVEDWDYWLRLSTRFKVMHIDGRPRFHYTADRPDSMTKMLGPRIAAGKQLLLNRHKQVLV